MTKMEVASYVAGVVIVAGAFALGHSMAPEKVRVIYQKRAEDAKLDLRRDTTENQTENWVAWTSADAVDNSIHWRTYTVYYPDGTIGVDKSVDKADTHRTAASSTTAATTDAKGSAEALHAESHIEYVYQDKLIERARPNWSIGASAGLGLDGRLRCQGEVSRRLFGGVSATLGVDVTARAALLGLRLEL